MNFFLTKNLSRCSFVCSLFFACHFLDAAEALEPTTPLVFNEIWAYLMTDEESFFPKESPITDVVYFCARINEEGRLGFIPAVAKLPAECSSIRKHVVIACSHNPSEMHWILQRDVKARHQLVQDILKASNGFDGVQIDFEGIRPQEAGAFLGFLKEVRSKLDKKKILSVAVMARSSDRKDAFSYSAISQIADRVVVMAYDEHWRSGKPGPIASTAWVRKIAEYAQKNIPAHKLVMGLPLYGRVWQLDDVAASLRHSSVINLWKKYKTPLTRLDDGTPTFDFEETVRATCYFEDLQSLRNKLTCYQSMNISSVAFWRLSQEPGRLWKALRSEKKVFLPKEQKNK